MKLPLILQSLLKPSSEFSFLILVGFSQWPPLIGCRKKIGKNVHVSIMKMFSEYLESVRRCFLLKSTFQKRDKASKNVVGDHTVLATSGVAFCEVLI
jgi:hypothetical protein